MAPNRRTRKTIPSPTVPAACAGAVLSIAACGVEGNDDPTVSVTAPEERVEPTRPTRELTPDASALDSGPGALPSPRPSATKDAEATVPDPDLYDAALVPAIELVFDHEAMAVLSSTDPTTKDTWVHGGFKLGDVAFADVGVRRKGSYTFRALPQKASLKVKLNKWVDGQKIYGLTELTLNNMVASPTFLAERLGFHVFRALGLPAQRANTAHVWINGEDYGIYANIETPNRRFLSRIFGDDANTLYEGNWGGEWLPGKERGFEIDVADPDVPEGATPDLSALFRAVATADNATLLVDVAGHLHTTQWLRYSATEGVIGQRDGYAYGVPGCHNYFLAGDTDGTFSLLPWSLDSTMSDHANVTDTATPLNDTLLTRCKLAPTCWEAYKAEVKWSVEGFERLDLGTLAREWHEQVDPLVKSDPKREVALSYYEERTRRLYEWIEARPNVVRAQLGL